MDTSAPPITTDTLLRLIGIKEVEIYTLKQQMETLIKENNKFRSELPETPKKEPKLVKK